MFMLAFGINLGYGQFDQEPQDEPKSVEKAVEKTIDKLEEITKSIDLEAFFEEDLPEFIEDIKPSPKEIENFEEKISDGIDCMKSFDASVIDEILEDILEGATEIKEDVEAEIEDYKHSKRKTNKI